MKLNAPIEGYFHVHEPNTIQVAGRIEFDVQSGIRLTTIGSFYKKDVRFGGEERWTSVHGFSTNGRRLTLLDCRGHVSTSIPGIPKGSYSSVCLLTGHQHFDSSSSQIMSTAFRTTYLDEWLNRSGVSYEASRDEHGGFTATHKHQGAIRLHFGSRLNISIWHHTTTPMFAQHDVLHQFSEQAYINIEYSELVTIEQAMDDMLMMRDFFSLLTSSPIVIEDAVAYINGEKEDDGRRFDLYFPLGYEYLARESHKRHYMLYPYDDIESFIGTTLGQWIELYPSIKRGIAFYHESYFSRTRHAFQKFIDYVFSYESTNRSLHPMERFLTDEYTTLKNNIIVGLAPSQAKFISGILEHANQATLRQRLKKTFERTALCSVFDNRSVKIHTDRIVNARNNIVHFAEINSEETVSEENVVDYNTLLRMLIVGELLLAIGIPKNVIVNRLKRNPNFSFLLSGKKLNSLSV
jgi:hypothetical protein